jgi:beta-lactamase class A
MTPRTSLIASERSDLNRNPRRREKRRPPSALTSVTIYMIRLLIMGVGIGAIAGTVLTFLDPTSPLAAYLHPTQPAKDKEGEPKSPQAALQATQMSAAASTSPLVTTPLSLSEELLPLNKKIEALAAKSPKLQPGAFFVDVDNGNYVDFKAENVFSAASTIKLPILVAFFQDVDAGKIRLDEKLTMTKEVIGGGSGKMQYQKLGSKYTALETATQMIIISDNTATNMLIARLGGKEALNQRFQEWGLTSTAIGNPLPDLEGTNTTSPKDLATVLMKVNQGDLISLKSRDRLLNIMVQTRTRTLLPQGLEEDATIAHKTGDIGSILGDAGIIDMPSGKRYIGAVIVKRPHNDSAARTLIQQISKTAYQHFKWYQPSQATSPKPGIEKENAIQQAQRNQALVN